MPRIGEVGLSNRTGNLFDRAGKGDNSLAVGIQRSIIVVHGGSAGGAEDRSPKSDV
jgi:hypothetical protein